MTTHIVTPELIAQMASEMVWQKWAACGWTRHPSPKQSGRIMAVNVEKRMATDGAKQLKTLITWLEREHISYLHFMRFHNHKATPNHAAS